MGGQQPGQSGIPQDWRSTVDKFQAGQDAKAMPDQIASAVNGMFGDKQLADQYGAKAQAIESTPVAAGGGGGYKFTPAQIEQQLHLCDELITTFQTRGVQNAKTIAQTPSPAPDSSSTGQAQATCDMGTRLEQGVQNDIKFIKHWQDQLKAVRQNYLEQEGNSVDTWKKLSGGLYGDEA